MADIKRSLFLLLFSLLRFVRVSFAILSTMHCYIFFIVSFFFFMTTENSLAYELTDPEPRAQIGDLDLSANFPEFPGSDNPPDISEADVLPCDTVGFNFEKRAVAEAPCNEVRRNQNLENENGNIKTPSSGSDVPSTTNGQPNNPEIKVPSIEVDVNLNPFIRIDRFDDARRRCSALKKTYVCTGRLDSLRNVEGCYLCMSCYRAILWIPVPLPQKEFYTRDLYLSFFFSPTVTNSLYRSLGRYPFFMAFNIWLSTQLLLLWWSPRCKWRRFPRPFPQNVP